MRPSSRSRQALALASSAHKPDEKKKAEEKPGVAASELFVSTTVGAEDLHLIQGAPAIDHMTTHAQEPSPDIDFDMRPSTGPWDVGADEYASIP